MALFNADLSSELGQIKLAAQEIVDDQITPMVTQAIAQAGKELSVVVAQAGEQVQANIKTLSEEIHNQRRLTTEELTGLIDYAAVRLGTAVDQRVHQAREEMSALFAEKLAQLKNELEDAAIRSRKTLYTNIALSVTAAVLMAAIGIVYKKISLGELDIFNVFRVAVISAASGTGVFAILKTLAQWRALNRTKKNAVTTIINYLAIFRPNGAIGLFFICVALLALWVALTYYNH